MLLVLLSSSQPCSALVDAVKKHIPELNSSNTDTDVSIHLGEADGAELYAEDALSDVLSGAKETVVVVFKLVTSSTRKLETPHTN